MDHVMLFTRTRLKNTMQISFLSIFRIRKKNPFYLITVCKPCKVNSPRPLESCYMIILRGSRFPHINIKEKPIIQRKTMAEGGLSRKFCLYLSTGFLRPFLYAALRHRPRYFQRMSKNAMQFWPPIGLFNRLITKKRGNCLDIAKA